MNYVEPMKLNIQLFAAPDPDTILINLYFKDIVESELPESLIFSFDGEQVTIPISGVSMNYVWNYWGSSTFNSITILSEGYLIIPYQIGNAIVDIDIYKNFSFVKKILEDNTINQTKPDFSQVATTDEGMFTAEDNDGVSTYFRGAVTNNYVKFANFWWRIIRVNGNGSVRLIYDGTTAHANGESSTDRRIGTSAFNTNIDDNAYVGYMYGTPGSTTYEATHANVNDSSIKTTLDNWYESNLSNYSDYIDTEAGFCGDRTSYSGTGTGTSRTYYGAYNRVVNNKQPTFECSNSSDLYTTSGSSQGNKALQYPIGLITADEVAYAGGVYATNNRSYYLYTNSTYWTMSPYNYGGDANVFYVYSAGYLNGINYVAIAYSVRPVINLRGDLFVTGTGTSTDPYEVSLPVVPATIFNGTELTNIYYNGTEISKMYCNGVLVFEKGPSAVYKRRIMVGDNLRGKTLYFDGLTKAEMNEITSIIRSENTTLVIETLTNTGIEAIEGGDLPSLGIYPYFRIRNIDIPIYFYDIYNDELDICLNKSVVKNDRDYVVTDISWKYASFAGGEYINNDGFLYRKFYIEDPNIRPIQVGDKIIEGTQLYFNFPDNPDSWLTGKYGCEVIKCGDKSIMDYFTEQPVSRAVSAISSIRLESNDMYEFDLATLKIRRNLSSYIIKFYYQDAVSYVDDKFQQYILVDTTTLGV